MKFDLAKISKKYFLQKKLLTVIQTLHLRNVTICKVNILMNEYILCTLISPIKMIFLILISFIGFDKDLKKLIKQRKVQSGNPVKSTHNDVSKILQASPRKEALKTRGKIYVIQFRQIQT